MKGKISLITGSTSGIGKATAASLAAKGSFVIIVGRNENKGENVVAEIKAKMHNDNVFFEACDLADQASISDFAYRINKNYPRVDVLINNAGCFTEKIQFTNDGIESQFGINHIAHFLLTHLLMPSLNKSEAARIVNVSSDAHYRGTMNFTDLYFQQKYSAIKAYAQSKLANVLFTYELNRKLKANNHHTITVNALHPGEIKTQLVEKNDNKLFGLAWKLAKPIMQSVEKGAQTSVFLASDKQMEGLSGQYWSKMKLKRSSKESYDKQVADRLWNISRVLCSQYLKDAV